MMNLVPTDEQRAIIQDELLAQCVRACAGSGKTFAAVRRMLEIRKRIGRHKGYVALLSYSNVAVETFRKEYAELAKQEVGISNRILISTVDSFIAANILLPHSGRDMQSSRRPFLVQGGEPFLNSFKVYNGEYGADIRTLRILMGKGGDFEYMEVSNYGIQKQIEEKAAIAAIQKLGKCGAYTHDIGRYWCLKTLIDQEHVLKALACKYPYILVDEAQDIGSMHAMLLAILHESGSKVSLIGDPNQAIFEFADADGSVLGTFHDGKALERKITENRRSVTQIVEVAKSISGTDSKAIRVAPERKHGAYFIRYKEPDIDQLLPMFSSILTTHGYKIRDSAILCRGSTLVDRLAGGANETGQGATDRLARAAIHRDKNEDIAAAFQLLLDGVLKLIKDPEPTLRMDILDNSTNENSREVRRILWRFLRSREAGLPSASLKAKSQWHPLLKKRLPTLLQELEAVGSLRRSTSWSNNFTVKKLVDDPLWQSDLASDELAKFRVDTVHKAKGESIDAVMYVATKSQVKSLLEGPVSEEGRIGYVAITRARDFLMLAIPATTGTEHISKLSKIGFEEWAVT